MTTLELRQSPENSWFTITLPLMKVGSSGESGKKKINRGPESPREAWMRRMKYFSFPKNKEGSVGRWGTNYFMGMA